MGMNGNFPAPRVRFVPNPDTRLPFVPTSGAGPGGGGMPAPPSATTERPEIAGLLETSFYLSGFETIAPLPPQFNHR